MYSYDTSTTYQLATAASAVFTVLASYQFISVRQQGQTAKAALIAEANNLYTEFNRFFYSGQESDIAKVTDKFSEQNIKKMIDPILKGGKDAAIALNLYIETAYDGIAQFSESQGSSKASGAILKNIPQKETLLQHIAPIQKMVEAGYKYIVGGIASTAIFGALSYSANDADSKSLAGANHQDSEN